MPKTHEKSHNTKSKTSPITHSSNSPGEAKVEKALIEKLSLVIYHKGFKKKSEKYKNLLKKWNGPVTAANEVEKFLRTKKIKSKESFIEKVFRLKSILKTF